MGLAVYSSTLEVFLQEQKMLKGHLPGVRYHRVYFCMRRQSPGMRDASASRVRPRTSCPSKLTTWSPTWCVGGALGPLGFNSPDIAQRHALHVERTGGGVQGVGFLTDGRRANAPPSTPPPTFLDYGSFLRRRVLRQTPRLGVPLNDNKCKCN